jgi:hypothetical protein
MNAFARRVRLITAAALLAASVIPTTASANKDGSFMDLRKLYQIAVAERGDTVNRAMAAAEAILAADPKDAVARAYKGSLLTMMGGDAWMPWNKLRYVNRGMDMLDAAVAEAKDAKDHGLDGEAEILLVAAFTNSRLPSMFNRAAAARQQIRRLIALPTFASLETSLQARALAIAAAYAHQDGNKAESDALLARAVALNEREARREFNERK